MYNTYDIIGVFRSFKGVYTVLLRGIRAKWLSKGGLKNLEESMLKLRAILELLQTCIFKIFFNHGDGNIEEVSQIESHSGAS